MKKVTLLLPDKIIRVLGTSSMSRTSEIDLTPENMINVLVVDEYHESFKFKREQVKVLSIESVDDEDQRWGIEFPGTQYVIKESPDNLYY